MSAPVSIIGHGEKRAALRLHDIDVVSDTQGISRSLAAVMSELEPDQFDKRLHIAYSQMIGFDTSLLKSVYEHGLDGSDIQQALMSYLSASDDVNVYDNRAHHTLLRINRVLGRHLFDGERGKVNFTQGQYDFSIGTRTVIEGLSMTINDHEPLEQRRRSTVKQCLEGITSACEAMGIEVEEDMTEYLKVDVAMWWLCDKEDYVTSFTIGHLDGHKRRWGYGRDINDDRTITIKGQTYKLRDLSKKERHDDETRQAIALMRDHFYYNNFDTARADLLFGMIDQWLDERDLKKRDTLAKEMEARLAELITLFFASRFDHKAFAAQGFQRAGIIEEYLGRPLAGTQRHLTDIGKSHTREGQGYVETEVDIMIDPEDEDRPSSPKEIR